MMDRDKVDAIVRWPHSTNLKELQIFLSLASFYDKFIRDYAKIAVPMMNQLKDKGHSFTWGEEQQRSFDKLKVAFATAALILAIVDPRKSFFVETDDNAIAIGAVLIQGGQPITFESKKLNRDQ